MTQSFQPSLCLLFRSRFEQHFFFQRQRKKLRKLLRKSRDRLAGAGRESNTGETNSSSTSWKAWTCWCRPKVMDAPFTVMRLWTIDKERLPYTRLRFELIHRNRTGRSFVLQNVVLKNSYVRIYRQLFKLAAGDSCADGTFWGGRRLPVL